MICPQSTDEEPEAPRRFRPPQSKWLNGELQAGSSDPTAATSTPLPMERKAFPVILRADGQG